VATQLAWAAAPDWSISAQTARACVGETIKLHAASSDANALAKITQWTADPKLVKLSSTTGSDVLATILGKPANRSIAIAATAMGGQSDSVADTVAIGVPDECLALGRKEIVRTILGMEQTGASGTASSQSFVFDFFLTRPAAGQRVRWWGDVKVATFPQQINSQVVALEQQFAATFGNIRVNQLAQDVEFITGPEFVITPDRASRFQLTLFGGAGAAGPNNPSDAETVFSLPASGTPALTAFSNEFGAPPAGARYVAFLPDSNNRFLRQWQSGVRLYTMYPNSRNSMGALPATIEFSVGQNEMVTSGHLSGFVGHVAAVHPFTFTAGGKAVTVYLFGEATTGFTHSTLTPPVTLAPALSNASPVPLTDPGVYTISVPSNRRDTYRIGIGVDLVSFLDALFATAKPAAPATN